ncbi:MAG TPA: sulfurtransferase TusA family protein [Anaerolineae bacterium]|jgi:TusA-related sulfurtransferase|nr:sulfurtransferase TusA family protein [Anaerolineae bacterium]
MSVQVDKTVDARGSYCPGPLMELIKTVKAASVGNTVEVWSSDQGSVNDIPEWVKKVGHELLYSEKADDGEYWRIAVKKVK